jgi:hypothetical protein
MATGGKPDSAAPPQAPSAAKGVFMRRIFPFLLATNVFIGGEREREETPHRSIYPLFTLVLATVCLIQF